MASDDLPLILRNIVGASHVLTDAQEMAPFLSDWRGRYHGRAQAIVKPGDVDELAKICAACYEYGIPMVPQGGNTGLVGGGIPDSQGHAIVINLSRLNHIRQIDALNNTIHVESGCLLSQVQEAAESVERLFPLSLASEGSCQIGGNISTNAGGVHVLRYGNTRDLVLGLEVVLPDGRIWNGLRALRKDNTGYDLKHLFIGAEGTLGIISAAVLKLFARPHNMQVAWLALPDAVDLLSVLSLLREHCGERINAYECISHPTLELLLKHIPNSRHPLNTNAPWYALVELADVTTGVDLAAMLTEVLERAFQAGWVSDAVVAQSDGQAQALWALRENASEAQRLEGISIKHDISLPVSCIPAFLAACEADLRQVYPNVRVVAFGHVGDGNLHYNLSKSAQEGNATFIARSNEVNRIVHDRVISYGGSISAEHGLGQLKRDEILRYKTTLEIDLMRDIKRTLDPKGLMNPGKVL